MRHGFKYVKGDRLVAVFEDENGNRHYQGKRVPKNCPIPPEVRREYVKTGVISATFMLMDITGLSLSQAWETIKSYRKGK